MKNLADISTYQSGVIQSSAHRITMKVKSDYLAQYDLTPMQWFVMGYAYDAGRDGVRLSELRNAFDASMPFITNIVNSLESKGIITKETSPDDTRVKKAVLNQKHKKLVDKIESGLRDELRKELYHHSEITREELQVYLTVLYKITQQ